MTITNDPATWPTGDRSWDMARAIAQTEGASIAGSVPDRLNNPGDISDYAKEYSADLHDGSFVTKFPDKQTGWNALHEKLENIRLGLSHVYRPDWTFTRLSQTYAGNSAAWCADVTRILGVSPESTLKDFWESSSPAVGPAAG